MNNQLKIQMTIEDQKKFLQLEGEFLRLLKKQDLTFCKPLFKDFFATLPVVRGAYFLAIKLRILKMVMKGLNGLLELDVETSQVIHFKTKYSKEIEKMNDYNALEAWLNSVTYEMEYMIKEKIGIKKKMIMAKEYIRKNYKRELDLGDVANFVGLSESYFSKAFKNYTDQKFVDYVTALRIKEALRFLETSDLRIIEIVEEVGFTSPNYFSRVFKEKIGCTPQEYRKGMRSTPGIKELNGE